MLDPGYIVTDTKAVIENCRNRGVNVDVEHVKTLILQWKSLSHKVDALKHEQSEREKKTLAVYSTRWKKQFPKFS